MTPDVMSNGLAIYLNGDGDPALLMPYPHAASVLGRDDATPRALVDGLLALDRRVISFDPPASGHSVRPMRLDMAEMLGCADEALDAAGVDGAVDVIGHSQGAVVALALAIEHPERVRRVVLVGVGAAGRSWMSAGGALWNRSHPDYWRCGLWGLAFQATRRLAPEKSYLNRITRASYFDPRQAPQHSIGWRDWFRPANARLQWAWIARRLDLRDRLADVSAPALVLAGMNDPQMPPSVNEEVAHGLPRSTLEFVARCGHYPFLEHPQQFWSIVREWLTSSPLRIGAA